MVKHNTSNSSSYNADSSYATSYSNYVRNNIALSSRYAASDYSTKNLTQSSVKSRETSAIPVHVKVTVTAKTEPRSIAKSEYQLYQNSLQSYQAPEYRRPRIETTNYYVPQNTNSDYLSNRMLGSSELKETSNKAKLSIGETKIKIIDLDTYNRLLTPTWRKYRENKYEETQTPEIELPEYLENYSNKHANELESTTKINSGYKLSRSISTSAVSKSSKKSDYKLTSRRVERSVTPESREERELTPVRITEDLKPLYLGRTSRDTSVHWPGRNCTAKELTRIITEPSQGNYVIPFDAFNEVYPGLYLGDM